jgi:antitoxin FitA
MAQIVLKNVDDSLMERLKRRAKQHRRNLQEEVRSILRVAAVEEKAVRGGLGTEIAALFRNAGLDQEIRELRCPIPAPRTRNRRSRRC